MKILGAVVLVLFSGTSAVAQVAVGVAEWMHPVAVGMEESGSTGRPIEQFGVLNRDEQISTDGSGAIDVIFERGSRLLVGPSCELVLDESYYDPRLDDVVSFDVYTQTVCVVRGGAGAETLELETPLAKVVIKDVSATIAYYRTGDTASDTQQGSTDNLPSRSAVIKDMAAIGNLGPSRSAVIQAMAAIGNLGTERLVVYLDRGLSEGGFVEVSANGRTSVLRRPGFVVRAAPAIGVLSPERGDPVELGALSASLEAAGPTLADPGRFDDRRVEVSFGELHQLIEMLGTVGLGNIPACAATAFCDAQPTQFNGFISLTFP